MPADLFPASRYYHGRPASMDELVELIRHRLWREGKSVRYWLKKIREYRDKAWDASREGDKEFAYIYAFKAAVLIFDKMPKLEDFRNLLELQQKNNLAEHGNQLVDLINSLTPQLRQEYDQWREAERLRVEAVEAVRRAKAAESKDLPPIPIEASQGTCETSEGSQVPPAESTPSGPPPEYYSASTLEVETEKQREMRILSADISRPGTPVSHDTPLPPDLLNGPPPSSPIAASRPELKDHGDGCDEGLNDGDYGDSHWAGGRLPSYEDVLAEILQEGPTGNFSSSGGGATALSPDCREDNGSDYNIQVVEPEPSTRAVTPQLDESAVDEKKNLKRREEERAASEPVATAEPSAPLSRRSSISKDKRSNLEVRNPTSSDADPPSAQSAQAFDLEVLKKALDTVYGQLELLESSGTSSQLPKDIKKKIVNLPQFLIQ